MARRGALYIRRWYYEQGIEVDWELQALVISRFRYPGTTDQCTARCEVDSDCEGDSATDCSGGFVCATPLITGPFGCESFCVCQDANPDTALPAACQ